MAKSLEQLNDYLFPAEVYQTSQNIIRHPVAWEMGVAVFRLNHENPGMAELPARYARKIGGSGIYLAVHHPRHPEQIIGDADGEINEFGIWTPDERTFSVPWLDKENDEIRELPAIEGYFRGPDETDLALRAITGVVHAPRDDAERYDLLQTV